MMMSPSLSCDNARHKHKQHNNDVNTTTTSESSSSCVIIESTVNNSNNNKIRNEDNNRNHHSDTDIDILPDDIWRHIFMFVGIGNYRFVALTSKRFHDIYQSLFKLNGCFLSTSGPNKMTQTYMSSVVESISRCELFLKEKQQQQNHNVTMITKKMEETGGCNSIMSSSSETTIIQQQQQQPDYYATLIRHRNNNSIINNKNDKSDELLRRIARYAALVGNLCVLKYVVDKSWGDYLQRDKSICRNAILGQHQHILEYAKSNGFK